MIWYETSSPSTWSSVFPLETNHSSHYRSPCVVVGICTHLTVDQQRSVAVMNGKRAMILTVPDSKVHGANMGPTWVLSAPDGPHVGPMNLAIRVSSITNCSLSAFGSVSVLACRDAARKCRSNTSFAWWPWYHRAWWTCSRDCVAWVIVTIYQNFCITWFM